MATGAARPQFRSPPPTRRAIDQALQDARASNTRRQYRSAWKGWAEWAGFQGHRALPADPAAAAYLADRTEHGAAASIHRPSSSRSHRSHPP